MKKSLKVFLTYAALMLADGGLTLYNTPDLSMEGNPLVTKLHLGWGALITVNLIFFVIDWFICRYTFEQYETVKADVPNMRSYISQLFFNRPDKFIWFWYKFPKNWKPFWAVMGYAYVYSACVAAVIRVLEWLAITFRLDTDSYFRFRSAVFFGRTDIVAACVAMLWLICIWFRAEYRKSADTTLKKE